MIGRRLGHYEILEEIGQGGMGRVFLASDLRLGRKVAIKLLPERFASDPERTERFKREARAVAALNHPNIVTLFSEEESDGSVFLTMEFVDGQALSELIPEAGLPLERFFEYAIPLADALGTAEDAGVTHRDIKPANIMVGTKSGLKILDFGLAKLFAAPDETTDLDATTELLTRQDRILGTRPYMSPEQLQGIAVDHRSDIFSLGIVLYEMATGERPFVGSTTAELISSILRDQPSSVSETRRDLPHHLGRIVGHCLEKDPERRYQTAKDLRNDLESLRAELASSETGGGTLSWTTSPSSASGASPIRSRARRLVLAGSVVLALMLTVIAAGLLRRSWPSRETGAPLVSLGVLPFDDDSPDARDGYLALGISSGLMTRLDEIHGVSVASSDLLWPLADRELEATEIGRRLSLSHVLEGTVRVDDGTLEVVPRLRDAATGIVLWSRPASANEEEILRLQRQLTRELADVLEIPLSRNERRRLARDPTESLAAYDYYLNGLQRLRDRDSRPEFAAQSFREALRLDSTFALAHVGLSDALRKIYTRDLDPTILAEAEAAANRAIELDAELPAGYLMRARLLRMTGRLGESIAELEDLVATHPKPSQAYRELAFSFSAGGETSRALDCLRAAVALDPEDWSAWNSLGAMYLRSGDYDGARSAFQKATSIVPKGINWPQQNLATVALYEGDFEAAVAAYEQIPGATQDVDLVSNIGTAYFFLGQLDRAEEQYLLAVDLNPQDDVSHRNLGDVYARQGRTELARSEYRLALDLIEERLADSPTNVGARLLRSLYAGKTGECDRALSEAEDLYRDLEGDVETLHQLAQTFALCGDRDAALAALENGVALGLSPRLIVEEDEFLLVRNDPAFQALLTREVN